MITERDYPFMRLAIEEAARSKRRTETDPKVGAVVTINGKLVGSAHRGQFAAGDHAEFTLLHEILKNNDLTKGATLYTTLEPCTSRLRKLACVYWIVRKEIQRVVIGIPDPNPDISGRGYWYLVRDANIEVDFFPSELAREIIRMNDCFIAQQRIRAEPVESERSKSIAESTQIDVTEV